MFLTPLASGKMLFGYMRYTTDDIIYRVFDGSTWGTATTVGSIGSTANTIKHVSADSDGVQKAYVAYLTSGNSGSIKVAKWNYTGSWIGTETADSTLSHTLPSITITADGVIHVYSLSGSKVYDTKKILNSWQTPSNPFGTTFTSPDLLTSGSGYPMALWVEGSSSPFNLRFDKTDWDVDRDGIYSNWEVNGIDSNWDGTTDFTPAASSQNHKDIYVEIDYMQFHGPRLDARNDVISAFANAPVTNPDSVNGITLHLDLDEQLTHSDTTSWPSGYNSIKATNFGTVAERGAANHDNILNAKKKIYHYDLWVHNQVGTTASGIAEILGNDFMVSLGSFDFDFTQLHNVGSRAQQAGTLMHELGHNLGLRHGGGVDVNCKPNYLSVMSYAFQFTDFVSGRPLDYSRSQLATLDEIELYEPDGVSASTPSGLTTAYGQSGATPTVLTAATGQAIDWNRDGFDGDDGVEESINNFGIGGCSGNDLTSLTGYNDWSNIQLPFTSSGTYANGTSIKIADGEITSETVQQMRLITLNTIDHLLQTTNTTSFSVPSNATAEKSVLRDAFENPIHGAKAAVEKHDYQTVLSILQKIRAKLDGSAGGDRRDDVIVNDKEQTRILQQLDNVIGAFKKTLE
jgi:hypothetical protein